MKHLKKITAAVFLAISPLQAQTDTPASGEYIVSLPNNILRRIRQNPDHFIRNTISTLFRISSNGIVTQETIDTFHQLKVAKTRSKWLYSALLYDLDGDMQIDAREIETLNSVLNSNENAEFQTLLALSDTNQDGDLSLDEIRANADKQAEKIHLDALTSVLMAFDMDQDGRVTPDEIRPAITSLQEQESAAQDQQPLVQQNSTTTQPANSSMCKYPAPSPDAMVLYLSGDHGSAVSTVAVAGVDRNTSVAVLDIEKGDKPLYIIATAGGAIIWKIEGENSRVEHFVAGYGRVGVGVAGIPKNNVTFLPDAACISQPFSNPDSGKALTIRKGLSQRVGKTIDRVISNYELSKITLPLGIMSRPQATTKRGTVIMQNGKRYVITPDGLKLLDIPKTEAEDALEKRLLHSLYRFYPGGIVELDAKDVVASSKAENYAVLPNQAGLLQLAREGALEQTEDGHLVIVKPIARFPAGLNGAHSVKFILGKGIKMPAGDPGHSEVILEENGECVVGYSCP